MDRSAVAGTSCEVCADGVFLARVMIFPDQAIIEKRRSGNVGAPVRARSQRAAAGTRRRCEVLEVPAADQGGKVAVVHRPRCVLQHDDQTGKDQLPPPSRNQ